VWHVEGEGQGRPAASSDTVYFLSARHEVVAIDAGTGALRWRQGTSEPGPSTFGSAVVLGGPVVVVGDYNLIAFDRITGAFRWRFVPVIGYGPGIYLGHTMPSIVLAGSPAGRVYALSTATGDLVWSTVIAHDGRTTVFQPVIDRGDVAVAFATFSAPPRGGAALLDLATGRERWRASFPAAADPLVGTGAAGGPVITDALVIAASGDGTIHALDRRSGSPRWTLPPVVAAASGIPAPAPGLRPPPLASGADFRPLTISGGTLIAGSLRSHVVGYDLASGRERWRHVDVASGSVSFAAASDDRYAYLPYVSGRQIAIDAATGIERWRTSTREGFHWPPAAANGRVYLAGSKGGFVALQR
jgi:outer membrane protein assembly factor BamB